MQSYIKRTLVSPENNRGIGTGVISIFPCIDRQGRLHGIIRQGEPLGDIPLKEHIGGGKPDMIIRISAGHTGMFYRCLQVHGIGIQVAHPNLSLVEIREREHKDTVGDPHDEVIPPLMKKDNGAHIPRQQWMIDYLEISRIQLFSPLGHPPIELSFFGTKPKRTKRILQNRIATNRRLFFIKKKCLCLIFFRDIASNTLHGDHPNIPQRILRNALTMIQSKPLLVGDTSPRSTYLQMPQRLVSQAIALYRRIEHTI